MEVDWAAQVRARSRDEWCSSGVAGNSVPVPSDSGWNQLGKGGDVIRDGTAAGVAGTE